MMEGSLLSHARLLGGQIRLERTSSKQQATSNKHHRCTVITVQYVLLACAVLYCTGQVLVLLVLYLQILVPYIYIYIHHYCPATSTQRRDSPLLFM